MLSTFKIVLYSLSLKLSVDAKIASDHFIFTRIQAKVGLIFHSAAEKRDFHIAFIKIFESICNETSSLIVGIKGNSSDSIHFILNLQLFERISKLSLINSISTSSSKTKLI